MSQTYKIINFYLDKVFIFKKLLNTKEILVLTFFTNLTISFILTTFKN